jgi:hypothetical protein
MGWFCPTAFDDAIDAFWLFEYVVARILPAHSGLTIWGIPLYAADEQRSNATVAMPQPS